MKLGNLLTEFFHADVICDAQADLHRRLRKERLRRKVAESAKRIAKHLKPEAARELLARYEEER